MKQSRALRGVRVMLPLLALGMAVSSCASTNTPSISGSGSSQTLGESAGESLIKEILGRDLVLAGGYTTELKDKPFRLNFDGTVSGAEETLLLMSKAKHWRFQNGTLDLCPTQACENWSSWTVDRGEKSFLVSGEAYLLTLTGAKTSEGEPVTRTVIAVE